MLAKDLIDRLERLGLLDQEIIDALREQLQQGGARVTPEAVAKLLVDNGQLTTFQATKLIGELRDSQYDEPAAVEVVDDLGIAAEFADVDDAMPVEAMPVDVIGVEAVPVEAVPVEATAIPVEAVVASEPGAHPNAQSRPTRRRPAQEEKSVWDSFKIYGFVGIVAFLAIGTFSLWWLLGREDADLVIRRADELYDQQNYQGAQEAYMSFLDNYGEDNQHASKARVRRTMTELYKAAQFKQEPERAVIVAEEKLPAIVEEEGMNEDRGNLAQLLVDIANNLTTTADKADATTRKRELLDQLDNHYQLINNPLYVTSTMKVTLGAQIKAVDESRARVERDINRNVRLDASESSMTAALEQKDTKAAYDIRMELLQDFPELHDHSRLQTLIRSASEIQQTLVSASTQLPRVSEGINDAEAIPTIVLTTLDGSPAPSLRGETIYLRAGGGVMAFDGETGNIRWRKFIGYAKDLPPVRIPGDSGVLLSDSQTDEVLRCAADTGRELWRSKIDEPFFEPIAERGDVFAAAPSGRLYNLDVETGDAKWVTQFPQGITSGPGVDTRANRVYQAGDHSNLYVVDAQSGQCTESYYLGHEVGTVSTPPVPLLGHVFVIENATPTYANVHVLRVDKEGNGLRQAQPPFRLVGNVRVNPVVEGRQLIVLTDRGEVKVLDIEPTAETEQVTEAAHLAPFYDGPTETQMAVGRTSMWITGTRIGRYELQINTGRVVRKWSLHELDTFIGRPFLKDNVLVHSRILRGSSAIRVTATDPKTGAEIWRTDVGVPVAAIRRVVGESKFHAITTQAALFELDSKALAAGATRKPLEDPGAKSVGIRYTDPIRFGDSSLVMVDQSGGQKLLNYQPSRKRQKVREVTMQLPTGKPSGGAIASGGGLLLPLDTGRAVLVNEVTGGMKATPFQPLSDPSARIEWSQPVSVPDDDGQVVIADSRKKIYRLRVGDQIRALSTKDLEFQLLGPAAGVGDRYVASAAGPSVDLLIGYQMANLEPAFKIELSGRITWGPAAVNEDLALVQMADGTLHGFDAEGKEVWMVNTIKDTPAGQPMTADGKIVIAMQGGQIFSIDADAGKVAGQVEIGQPISATPFVLGRKMLVPGKEGVVYIVDTP